MGVWWQAGAGVHGAIGDGVLQARHISLGHEGGIHRSRALHRGVPCRDHGYPERLAQAQRHLLDTQGKMLKNLTYGASAQAPSILVAVTCPCIWTASHRDF